MNIDSMFVASDIWPQLTGSDHCPSWADVSLHSPLPPVPVLPTFSTRNTFTGRQNKLTGWLKSASVKPAVQVTLGRECSTESSQPSEKLEAAVPKAAVKAPGQEKV